MSFSPREIFDVLDVDVEGSEMQVLKTLIELSETGMKNLTANSIHDEFVRKRGREVSVSWIYKCLKSLEKEGLVLVDSMRRPHHYDTSPSVLRNAVLDRLKTMKQRKRAELDRQKEYLSILDSVDVDELAIYVLEQILGARTTVQERVVEGNEAVGHVMIEELVSKGGKGDVLRTIQPLATIQNANVVFGPFEEKMLDAMIKGLQIKALIVPPEGNIDVVCIMNDYLGSHRERVGTLIETGQLELRLLPTHRNTYRMMCMNSQTMLLFISELYLPDTAAVFYENDSYPIISDALNLFFELWEEAQDLGHALIKNIC